MGLERFARDAGRFAESGLHGHDLAANDDRGIHLAKGHAQQIKNTDAGAGGNALNVKSEVAREDGEKDQAADQQREEDDDPHDVADFRLCEQNHVLTFLYD